MSSPCSRYTGGKDVVPRHCWTLSAHLSYRIQAQEDGSALSWFQLSSYKTYRTTARTRSAPWCLRCRLTVRICSAATRTCPDVEFLNRDYRGRRQFFHLLLDGGQRRQETIKYVFNSSLLSIKFPNRSDLKTGDEVRFVFPATPGRAGNSVPCWLGRRESAHRQPTLKKGPPTEALAITDAVSGTFNYTPKPDSAGKTLRCRQRRNGVKDYVIKVAVRSTSPAHTHSPPRRPPTHAQTTALFTSPTQPARALRLNNA